MSKDSWWTKLSATVSAILSPPAQPGDWRAKARRHHTEQAVQKMKEEERKREARQQEFEKQKAVGLAEKALKIKKWAEDNNYRCHICGNLATKLGLVPERDYDFGYTYAETWDYPEDLKDCTLCHQKTCTKCMEAGICKKCVQTL